MNAFAICFGSIAPIFDPCVVIDPMGEFALIYFGAIFGAGLIATMLYARLS